MMAHNTPFTISTEAIGLGKSEPRHNPYYVSQPTPWQEELLSPPDNDFPPHSVATTQPIRSRNGCFTDFYGAVSWTLGFREKFSLVLCSYKNSVMLPAGSLLILVVIVFGGALIGFCLARAIMMYPANVRNKTVPGGRLLNL